MHRIDTTTAQLNKFGAGKHGYTEGTPGVTPPTETDADAFDAFQEELCNLVEGQGIALVKATKTQVLAAIRDPVGPAATATPAINGTGGSADGPGLRGVGGATNGRGVVGQGTGTGDGVHGTGGVGGGYGVVGVGIGAADGVHGTGGGTDGEGIRGIGGATNGTGVAGQGTGSGNGVYGVGGATNGVGVVGEGAGAGSGVYGTGGATGAGVTGVGGATGYGVVAQADTTTPAKAALRLVPQDTAPSVPAAGDVFTTDQGKLRSYNGTTWDKIIPQAHASIAQSLSAATTARTAFAEKYTIPANTLKVGSTIRIRACGKITATAGGGTLVLDIEVGTTVVALTAAVTCNLQKPYWFDVILTVRSIGNPGSIWGTALEVYDSGPSTLILTAGISENTTAALDVEVFYDLSDASDQVSLEQLIVDVT